MHEKHTKQIHSSTKETSMFEAKKNVKQSFSYICSHINFSFFVNAIPLYQSYRGIYHLIMKIMENASSLDSPPPMEWKFPFILN